MGDRLVTSKADAESSGESGQPFSLWLSWGLLRQYVSPDGDHDFSSITSLRERLSAYFGVAVPALRIRDLFFPDPRGILIEHYGMPSCSVAIEDGQVLAVADERVGYCNDLTRAAIPYVQGRCFWVDQADEVALDARGLKLFEGPALVELLLESVIRCNLEGLLSYDNAVELLESVRDRESSLCEALLIDETRLVRFTLTCRAMLREQMSITDVPAIARAVLSEDVDVPVSTIIARVRRALGEFCVGTTVLDPSLTEKGASEPPDWVLDRLLSEVGTLEAPRLIIQIGEGIKPPFDIDSQELRNATDELSEQFAVPIPPVEVQTDNHLSYTTCRILLNGQQLKEFVVHPNKVLAISRDENVSLLGAEAIRDPAFDEAAYWIEEDEIQDAHLMGLPTIQTRSVIAHTFTQVLIRNVADFFLERDTEAILEALVLTRPKLVTQIRKSPDILGRLTRIYRTLLRERFLIGIAPWIPDIVFLFSVVGESEAQTYRRVRAKFIEHGAHARDW